MTSGAAWNTRPFRPETLQAAREAARRSGLSLGEWLNSAILDTAADAGVHAYGRRFGPDELDRADEGVTGITERLDELVGRIDGLMRRAIAPHAPPAGTANRHAPEITASLHAIEARLGAILHELVPQSQTATQRLAAVIGDLNSRLDRLGAATPAFGDAAPRSAAADPTFGPCEENGAHAPDRDPGFHDALAEISARQRELDAELAGAQDISRLEQQIRHITEQIETLRHPAAAAETVEGPDRVAFERIEGRIVELAHKLDASDARLDSLGAIERNIADVMFQLQETRAAAAEEARRAAQAVAAEMLADSGGAGMEIDALKQELAAFRDHQAEIDRRTEDALGAVHDTLERLVDRLAMIETDARAVARASAEAEPVRAMPGSRLEPGSPASGANSPGAKWGPEFPRANSGLPPDQPLEPGSGMPRSRAVPSPDMRTVPSAASTASAASSPAAEPAAKANFIAAARRAAQAAAAESPEAPDHKGARPRAGPGVAAAVGRRRSLMIAAGVLLFGAGGLHLAFSDHFLPRPLNLGGFGRTETHHAVSEDATSPASTPKLAETAANPSGSGEALASDRVVPDTGPPAARRPSRASGDEFLLSPMPDGSLTSAADSQVRERGPASPAAPPPARGSDVTGALAPPSPSAEKPVPPATAREPAPGPAEKLPNAIGSSALRSAAVAGNPAAEYEIGLRFSEGRGVPQSFEQAAHWLARAADHGLAPAQYRLGSLREKGQGGKKDLTEASRLYLAAAQQGNAKAMHNLAVLYAVGLEGTPDYKAASEWFRKAADHGIADSQYNLGILYARGVGLEQNLAEAYKWFALAAQQGDKDAGKKRDDVAAQLEPQALDAARLAVRTWTAQPQPDQATKVEAPGGDWDRGAPNAPSAQTKPGRRTGSSGAV